MMTLATSACACPQNTADDNKHTVDLDTIENDMPYSLLHPCPPDVHPRFPAFIHVRTA